MKFILGKKIEMTQVWRNEVVVPVTKIKLETGIVVQTKNQTNDGYSAVVVGYGDRKTKNINKPQLGQMKGLGNFRYLKEFRYTFNKKTTEQAEFENLNKGDRVDLNTFEVGDMVDVIGTSKGKGFQGGVKRHGFHGQDKTHGTKDQVRMPGSVGAGEPQHVFKGTRMAGRMGNTRTTVKNLDIIEVNAEEGTMLIKGALPGARNGVLYIIGKGDLKITKAEDIKPVVKAEPVVEKIEAPVVTPVEVKEEAKVEAEAEVKKAEVVPEVKAEEKKEEPKAEEKPAEPVVKEVIAKRPPDEFKDENVGKFSQLSTEEKDKYSTPEMSSLMLALEEKYKVDLIPVITKVIVKELPVADLQTYLVGEMKLEAAKAEEIAKELKEKIFTTN